MGPTWVLSAPDGPHAGPMNLAIRDGYLWSTAHTNPAPPIPNPPTPTPPHPHPAVEFVTVALNSA